MGYSNRTRFKRDRIVRRNIRVIVWIAIICLAVITTVVTFGADFESCVLYIALNNYVAVDDAILQCKESISAFSILNYSNVLNFLLQPTSFGLIIIILRDIEYIYDVVWAYHVLKSLLKNLDYEMLRSKTSRLLDEFIKGLEHIHYLGSFGPIIPNVASILHPVDPFMLSLFNMLKPGSAPMIMAQYKRCNPTLELKLKHFKKYDKSDDSLEPEIMMMLKKKQMNMYEEMKKHPSYHSFLRELAEYLGDDSNFTNLEVDLSTAAGHPYKPGTSKRDVLKEACTLATSLIKSPENMRSFFDSHLWYSGGRAKMVEREVGDSARLISFPSFAVILLGMKFHQPYMKFFMKSCNRFSALGHSWTHFGSDRLAHHLGAQDGKAPPGFRFDSVDSSGWDPGVNSLFHFNRCEGYKSMIDDCAKLKLITSDTAFRWKNFFDLSFFDKINAKIVFPGGHVFRTHTGTKSGDVFTAIGNTEDNQTMFSVVMELNGLDEHNVRHKVGGDDLIACLPLSLHPDSLKGGYLRCGQILKHIHSSSELQFVDFYSNYMFFDKIQGHYYFMRPTDETFARLLMPEELDYRRRVAPDYVVAAERLLGHFIANWYNREVREVCLRLLTHLRDKYSIHEIEIKNSFRDMKFKGFALPRFMPTVPDYDYMKSMFGYDLLPNVVSYVYANTLYTKVPAFSLSLRDDNDFAGVIAEDYVMNINALKGARISSDNNYKVKRFARPFAIPHVLAGTAGGKIMEIITKHNILPTSLLDIGGHPGAIAASMQKKFPDLDITIVSKRYPGDRDFCPKVVRTDHIKLFELDFHDFEVKVNYDLVICDAYIEDLERASTIEQVEDLRRRHIQMCYDVSKKVVGHCNSFILKIPTMHADFYEVIYEIYLKFGSIDVFKPLYSYPWNTELYIYFYKDRYAGPPRRRRTVYDSLNSFRNRLSTRLSTWATVRSELLSDLRLGKLIDRNPLQSDSVFQKAIEDHVWDGKMLP